MDVIFSFRSELNFSGRSSQNQEEASEYGSGSDVTGFDETGIRPVRDLNSGPEKGKPCVHLSARM